MDPINCQRLIKAKAYRFEATRECMDALPFSIYEDCGEWVIEVEEDVLEPLRDGDYIVETVDYIQVHCDEEFKRLFQIVED